MEQVAGRSTMISQPGSSVATSLSEGESITKHIGILRVRPGGFELVPHRLRCVRPFKFRTVTLVNEPEVRAAREDAELTAPTGPSGVATSAAVQAALHRHTRELIEEAKADVEAMGAEADKPPAAMRLPLIRVRVDHTGFPVLPNKVFGAE